MRRKREEQLEKELRFHLEQHASDLIARGVDPEEARRQARLALGGPEQVKEQCRDVRRARWLDDLWQDFRYSLRTLRQKPGFAAVGLLTLALGTGATTVMFTVIHSVLLKPLAYPEPDRLVTLHEEGEKHGMSGSLSFPSFLDCKRESHTLAMAAWSYNGGGTVSEPGEPEYVTGRQITAGLFSVLGIPLLRGRAFLPEEDRPGAPPAIIIGYRLWQRRFGGNPAAIGMKMVLEGQPYTVVGVAPPGFQLAGEMDVFTALGQSKEPRMENREARFINAVARLLPGVTPAEAQADLSLFARQLAAQYPKSNAGREFVARPLRQELVENVRSTLWLLLAAVSLVLLIACVNVASLLLARAVSRQRELTMRAALGAGRGRLLRQCLTESAVLGLAGGLLGALLASVAIRPFVFFWPGNLPRAEEVQLDWRVLCVTLAVSGLCGLLFGLAPAFRTPAHGLEQTLRAGARSVAGSSRRLHGAFVMSEIALALVLLVAAGILGRTLLRQSFLDPGFSTHNTMVARVALSPGVLRNPAQMRAAWRDVLDRARSVAGVQSVALADVIPMGQGINALGFWTTAAPPPPNQMTIAVASTATPDYLNTIGIPLRRGRFFDEHDRVDSQPVVVIDDVLAQLAFPQQDPLGKRLWIQAIGPSEVIGVVGHVRHWGLAGDDQSGIRAQVYYPFAQVPDALMRTFAQFMTLTVRTSVDPLSVVGTLRREERGAAGDQSLYDVRTMEQLVSASLARQRFLVVLFGIFAGLALLLACIGIYGVLAYLTGQRVPEIGVRMALGASAREVRWMVLRQSLRMILVGTAVGAGTALVTGGLLARLVPGVRGIELLPFATMIAVLMTAALLASFLPAQRASRIDPMKALRQE